jgi:hypothetical protein
MVYRDQEGYMLWFSMMVGILLVKSQQSKESDAWSEMIPHMELQEKYRNSHFSTVFFWACVVHPKFLFES